MKGHRSRSCALRSTCLWSTSDLECRGSAATRRDRVSAAKTRYGPLGVGNVLPPRAPAPSTQQATLHSVHLVRNHVCRRLLACCAALAQGGPRLLGKLHRRPDARHRELVYRLQGRSGHRLSQGDDPLQR
eukprot:4345961-Prymnesium_polylepis.1